MLHGMHFMAWGENSGFFLRPLLLTMLSQFPVAIGFAAPGLGQGPISPHRRAVSHAFALMMKLAIGIGELG